MRQLLMVHRITSVFIVLFFSGVTFADDIPEFQWRSVEIDKIDVGYGLQLADVNGDGKTDIVLADKKNDSMV